MPTHLHVKVYSLENSELAKSSWHRADEITSRTTSPTLDTVMVHKLALSLSNCQEKRGNGMARPLRRSHSLALVKEERHRMCMRSLSVIGGVDEKVVCVYQWFVPISGRAL